MSMSESSRPQDKASGKEIFAWAMYDWANSAYTTLSITVLMYYITGFVLAPDSDAVGAAVRFAAGLNLHLAPKDFGDAFWGFGLAASMFVAALMSPVLGAIADARASKRWWLAVSAFSGAACAVLLYFVPHQMTILTIGLFLMMGVCFDISFGFYNGFLPELSDEESIDRISAWGYALGYLGGGLALAIAVLVLNMGDTFGIVGQLAQLKFGILIMGLWWGGFTIPTVMILRDRGTPRVQRQSVAQTTRLALHEVANTLRHIRRYRTLVLFLIAFLFFNDGIQTVIGQSSLFAKKDLGFEPAELVILILVFQFVCLAGALIVGFIIKQLGQKKTLLLYLSVWVVVLAGAYYVETKIQFWYLSFVLGIVIGGTQSVARAIMGLITPKHRSAEFFGFFNFSGKATSWMGSAMFGTMIHLTGSARLAIVSLIVFFVIGLLLVTKIDIAQGQRDAVGD